MAENRWDRGLGPSCQRTDPRNQNREVEWLWQIVIRAEAEPVHQVVDHRRGGEHQHPAATLAVHELGAELIAVHARQVAIEHDHVVLVDRGARETGRAVESDVHGHARLAQAERDRLGHLLVVLDHKHPHGRSAFHGRTSLQTRRVLQATSPRFQHGFAGGLE